MIQVLQRGLLGTAVEMMRIGEIFQFWWLTSRAVTAREEDEAVAAIPFLLGMQYAMFIRLKISVRIAKLVISLFQCVQYRCSSHCFQHYDPRSDASWRSFCGSEAFR